MVSYTTRIEQSLSDRLKELVLRQMFQLQRLSIRL